MHTSFWKLYLSGEYVDLTVICRDRKWDVHKAIVFSQCPFLAAACDEQIKMYPRDESPRHVIVLHDEEPDSIERLIQFLYLANYTDGEHYDGLPSIPGLMDTDEVQKKILSKDPDTIMSMQFEEDDSTLDSHCPTDYEEEDAEEDPEEYEEDDETLAQDAAGCNPHKGSPYYRALEGADCDDSYEKAICISMKMYILADKFQVPSLRLLAQERIMHSAQVYLLKVDNFVELLNELLMRAPRNDPLRQFLCNLISDRYCTDKDLRDKLRPIIESHSDFAILLLDSVARSVELKKEPVQKNSYEDPTEDLWW